MSIYTFDLTAGSKTTTLTIDIGYVYSKWSCARDFFQNRAGDVVWNESDIGLNTITGRVGILEGVKDLDVMPISTTGTLKVCLQPTSGSYTEPKGTWKLTSRV